MENAETTPPQFDLGNFKQSLFKKLPAETFMPRALRLIPYFLCGAAALTCYFAIVHFALSWPLKLALGLGLGLCNGTLSFFGHELLHGAIIKNHRLQNGLALLSSLPFLISPTFWRFWHNRLHHGKTQQLIRDPDAFPNLKIYKASRFTQTIFPYTPGSGHKRSYFYFFFWFSFHNLVAQTYLRHRNKIFDSLDHKKVSIEFAIQVVIVAALLTYAGPKNWLWVLVIPVLVQNYLLMSYISTNHNLSPLTNDNNPLRNSLTVTNHPWLERMHLNFGYHVEHHLFPTMSGTHLKTIHRELLKSYPQTFQVMPKWRAMKQLYNTARIYKNSNELVHPITLKTHPTL